jgi:hypothetical protein
MPISTLNRRRKCSPCIVNVGCTPSAQPAARALTDKRGFATIAHRGPRRLHPMIISLVEKGDPNAVRLAEADAYLDQNGVLWFTAQSANMIGRLDPKTGEVKLATSPTPRSNPYGLVITSTGVPFFCEFGANKLASVDPTTMAIREYAFAARRQPATANRHHARRYHLLHRLCAGLSRTLRSADRRIQGIRFALRPLVATRDQLAWPHLVSRRASASPGAVSSRPCPGGFPFALVLEEARPSGHHFRLVATQVRDRVCYCSDRRIRAF